MSVNGQSDNGRVASLHLHPLESGDPFQAVNEFYVVAEKGIQGNPRYFSRTSRSTGEPSKRQITLIEREQIAEQAAVLGLQAIPPGVVRSNIETFGIDLVSLIGSHLAIGKAVLYCYAPRTPCAKMDSICQGLRALMEGSHQGVLAQVVVDGQIRVGDSITMISNREAQQLRAKLL